MERTKRALAATLLSVAVLLLASPGQAQTIYPPSGGSFVGGTLTSPLLLPDGTAAAPSLAFSSASGAGLYWGGVANQFDWTAAATYGGSLRGGGLNLSSASLLSWRSNATPSGTVDLSLARDAANTLALRNGTNAQQFNLYETYTDAANYSRLAIQATAGAFKLLPAAAGTGTLRVVAIGDGGAKPTCEAATRGGIWYDAGGAGVADTLEVCRKDGADAYAWVSLF